MSRRSGPSGPKNNAATYIEDAVRRKYSNRLYPDFALDGDVVSGVRDFTDAETRDFAESLCCVLENAQAGKNIATSFVRNAAQNVLEQYSGLRQLDPSLASEARKLVGRRLGGATKKNITFFPKELALMKSSDPKESLAKLQEIKHRLRNEGPFEDFIHELFWPTFKPELARRPRGGQDGSGMQGPPTPASAEQKAGLPAEVQTKVASMEASLRLFDRTPFFLPDEAVGHLKALDPPTQLMVLEATAEGIKAGVARAAAFLANYIRNLGYRASDAAAANVPAAVVRRLLRLETVAANQAAQAASSGQQTRWGGTLFIRYQILAPLACAPARAAPRGRQGAGGCRRRRRGRCWTSSSATWRSGAAAATSATTSTTSRARAGRWRRRCRRTRRRCRLRRAPSSATSSYRPASAGPRPPTPPRPTPPRRPPPPPRRPPPTGPRARGRPPRPRTPPVRPAAGPRGRGAERGAAEAMLRALPARVAEALGRIDAGRARECASTGTPFDSARADAPLLRVLQCAGRRPPDGADAGGREAGGEAELVAAVLAELAEAGLAPDGRTLRNHAATLATRAAQSVGMDEEVRGKLFRLELFVDAGAALRPAPAGSPAGPSAARPAARPDVSVRLPTETVGRLRAASREGAVRALELLAGELSAGLAAPDGPAASWGAGAAAGRLLDRILAEVAPANGPAAGPSGPRGPWAAAVAASLPREVPAVLPAGGLSPAASAVPPPAIAAAWPPLSSSPPPAPPQWPVPHAHAPAPALALAAPSAEPSPAPSAIAPPASARQPQQPPPSPAPAVAPPTPPVPPAPAPGVPIPPGFPPQMAPAPSAPPPAAPQPAPPSVPAAAAPAPSSSVAPGSSLSAAAAPYVPPAGPGAEALEELARLRAQKAQMEEAVREARRRAQGPSEKEAALQGELVNLRLEIRQLRGELDEARAGQAHAQEQLQRVAAELREAHAQVLVARAAGEQLADLTARLERGEEERERLARELDASQRSCADLQLRFSSIAAFLPSPQVAVAAHPHPPHAAPTSPPHPQPAAAAPGTPAATPPQAGQQWAGRSPGAGQIPFAPYPYGYGPALPAGAPAAWVHPAYGAQGYGAYGASVPVVWDQAAQRYVPVHAPPPAAPKPGPPACLLADSRWQPGALCGEIARVAAEGPDAAPAGAAPAIVPSFSPAEAAATGAALALTLVPVLPGSPVDVPQFDPAACRDAYGAVRAVGARAVQLVAMQDASEEEAARAALHSFAIPESAGLAAPDGRRLQAIRLLRNPHDGTLYDASANCAAARAILRAADAARAAEAHRPGL